MNILSLFPLIPLVMMLGLWISKNTRQIHAVMVAGSSALLALAIYLVVPLPRPAGSRRYGRDAPYGQRRLVRSTQHPLRSGRGRYLGSHAATVGHHRLHGHVRLVADEERRQSLLPLVLPALGRCLRILHHRRSLLDVHVLRSGTDPDVPAHRRLGQRPQGVFGHEADADAHGRVGPAARAASWASTSAPGRRR